MVNVFISDHAALPPRRISFHAIHNIALHTSAPKPQSQVKLLLVFPFRSCAERDSTSLDPSSRRLFVSHRRNQKVFDVIIGIDLLIAVAITIRWLLSRLPSRSSPQPRDDVSIQEWRGKLIYGEGKFSRGIATSMTLEGK
jgi:hypothetical protein